MAVGDSWPKSYCCFTSSWVEESIVILLRLDKFEDLKFEIGIELQIDYSSMLSKRGDSRAAPSVVLGTSLNSFLLIAYFVS